MLTLYLASVNLRVWGGDKHVDYTHCSTPHVAALALQADILLKVSVGGGPYQEAATVVAMQPSVCSYCVVCTWAILLLSTLGTYVPEHVTLRNVDRNVAGFLPAK